MRFHHRRRVAELAQVEVVEGQVGAEHRDAGDAVAAKHVLCAWHHVIIIIMTFYNNNNNKKKKKKKKNIYKAP